VSVSRALTSEIVPSPDEEADVPRLLGELVEAIGRAEFPERFLSAMRAITGVTLCSVFRHDGRAGVQLVFAQGDAMGSDGGLAASRAYARHYWRSDAQLMRLARSGGGAPIVVRRRASEIADPAYRTACYERTGVGERVSLLCPGLPGLVANGYRLRDEPPLSSSALQRLEAYAGLLIAAIRQHVRADVAAGHLLDEAALSEALVALGCGLSTREAEVAAAIILGETQPRIAAAKHLSPATVVTYRRRAYGKLGVTSRRDLAALHRRLFVGAGGPERV
jgi:DNA-binding CsgD family transcriptional regulator